MAKRKSEKIIEHNGRKYVQKTTIRPVGERSRGMTALILTGMLGGVGLAGAAAVEYGFYEGKHVREFKKTHLANKPAGNKVATAPTTTSTPTATETITPAPTATPTPSPTKTKKVELTRAQCIQKLPIEVALGQKIMGGVHAETFNKLANVYNKH